jgi:hypothetical protein
MEIISLVWKQLKDLLRDTDMVDYYIRIDNFLLWTFLSEILSDLLDLIANVLSWTIQSLYKPWQ